MTDVDNAWQKCAADRFDDEMNGNPLNLPQGMPNLDDFKDGYRAGAAASAERIKELEAVVAALNWLATRTNFELSWSDDDEDGGEWCVFEVTGGVNDREWHLVATGRTPNRALMNARAKYEEGQP